MSVVNPSRHNKILIKETSSYRIQTIERLTISLIGAQREDSKTKNTDKNHPKIFQTYNLPTVDQTQILEA